MHALTHTHTHTPDIPTDGPVFSPLLYNGMEKTESEKKLLPGPHLRHWREIVVNIVYMYTYMFHMHLGPIVCSEGRTGVRGGDIGDTFSRELMPLLLSSRRYEIECNQKHSKRK
jgi:hypothetical protein